MFWIVTSCSVIVLGLVLALFADRLQRGRLLKRLAVHLGPGPGRVKKHPIIVFTIEALGSGKPMGRMGQPGFLLVEPHAIRVVTMGTPLQPLVSEALIDTESSTLGWIPVNSLTLGMTSLIRLRGDSGFFYVAARGRFGSPSQRGSVQLKELLSRRLRCQLIDTPPDHLMAMGLKLGLILTLVTSLAAAFFAYRSADLLGPEIVAGSGNRVAVASKNELLVMNSDGSVLQRLSLLELGIKGRLTELKWAAGNILYLGDVEAGTILRCDLEAVSCHRLPAMQGTGLEPLGAFSFALDVEHERIYLADSGNHRVLVLGIDGELIDEYRGPERKFCFPNTLRLARDSSHIYLSDTNNFRLAGFSMADGKPVAMPELEHHFFVSSLPDEYGCRHNRNLKFHEKWLDRSVDFNIKGRPQSINTVRADRVWGFDTLRDNSGHWWMILGDGNLRRGDLLRMGPKWIGPIRIELPAGADPASLTLLGDDLLVADPLRPAIYQVDSENLQVTEFGSPAYRAELETIMKGQRHARLFYYVCLALALLLLLVVLSLAIVNQRAQLRRILSAET